MRTARVILVSVVVTLCAWAANAQVAVNPTGVNVRQAGPSTVFLTFRNLQPAQTVGEGIWCAELNPDNSCVVGTIFGRLPPRLDLSQRNTSTNFTDIMTIPPSVVQRAYQRATSGLSSVFFYVREFSGPSEFVPVTCRLAGGGARSPLAVVDIQLLFEKDQLVQYVPRDSPPTPFGARIKYSGSGRFRGRWEIIKPGDPQPREVDLLPAGSLPADQRALQQTYTLLERFDIFLQPGSSHFLPGPDPQRLPHDSDGVYQILLRIEASDTPFSRSFTGSETVVAGGVAGFMIPPLRYFVGTANDPEIAVLAAGKRMQTLSPRDGQRIPKGQPVVFHWIGMQNAMVYEIDVRREGQDESVLSALVARTVASYTAPPFFATQVAGNPVRWRVVAIAEDGSPLYRSDWTDFAIEP